MGYFVTVMRCIQSIGAYGVGCEDLPEGRRELECSGGTGRDADDRDGDGPDGWGLSCRPCVVNHGASLLKAAGWATTNR